MVVKKRLYYSNDLKSLTEEGREGRFLFCSPGQEIPDRIAKKFGLLDKNGKEPEPPKEQEPPKEPELPKMAEQPPNKMAKKSRPKEGGLTINKE